MISFKDCKITVNNTGIMAKTAVISTDSPVTPLYELGHRGPISYSFEGAFRNDLRISYYVKPENEPIFNIIDELKNWNTLNQFPSTQIVVGGLTGNYYLTDISMSSNEYNILQAEASFVSFVPTSGELVASSNDYNPQSGVQLAHYCGAIVCERCHNDNESFFIDKTTSFNINSFNYKCSIEWNPVYFLGNSSPTYNKLLGINESLDLTHDFYKHLTLDTVYPTGFLTDSYRKSPSKSVAGERVFPELGISLFTYSGIPHTFEKTTYEDTRPFISLEQGVVKSVSISNEVGALSTVSLLINRSY